MITTPGFPKQATTSFIYTPYVSPPSHSKISSCVPLRSLLPNTLLDARLQTYTIYLMYDLNNAKVYSLPPRAMARAMD